MVEISNRFATLVTANGGAQGGGLRQLAFELTGERVQAVTALSRDEEFAADVLKSEATSLLEPLLPEELKLLMASEQLIEVCDAQDLPIPSALAVAMFEEGEPRILLNADRLRAEAQYQLHVAGVDSNDLEGILALQIAPLLAQELEELQLQIKLGELLGEAPESLPVFRETELLGLARQGEVVEELKGRATSIDSTEQAGVIAGRGLFHGQLSAINEDLVGSSTEADTPADPITVPPERGSAQGRTARLLRVMETVYYAEENNSVYGDWAPLQASAQEWYGGLRSLEFESSMQSIDTPASVSFWVDHSQISRVGLSRLRGIYTARTEALRSLPQETVRSFYTEQLSKAGIDLAQIISPPHPSHVAPSSRPPGSE